MSNNSTLSVFAKMVIAKLKGDTATEQALKNARKASNYLTSQVAALDTKILEKQDEVDSLTEKYHDAQAPVTMPGKVEIYIQGIVDAKYNLEVAQNEMAELQKSKEYFIALKDNLFADAPLEA